MFPTPPNTAMSHRLRAAAPHPERGGGVRGAGPAGARRRQLPHVPGPALPGEPGGDTRAPSPPSHPIPSPLLNRAPPSPERRHLRGRREQHLRLPLSPRLHRQQLRVLAGTALPPRWVPTPRGHHPLPSLPGCCPPPGAHRPSLSPPWAEACGPDATCVNRPDGQGYSCRCHLGKSGERCTEGEHGWGQGTGLGALWGQGHGGGDNAGDAGMGMGPLWGQGHGGGDNPREVEMGDTSVGMG